jgi:hypothetical protein
MDGMLITVLPDGTLKIETDKISSANHASAEAFLRDANNMMGGTVTRKRKGGLVGAVAQNIGMANQYKTVVKA